MLETSDKMSTQEHREIKKEVKELIISVTEIKTILRKSLK